MKSLVKEAGVESIIHVQELSDGYEGPINPGVNMHPPTTMVFFIPRQRALPGVLGALQRFAL